VADRRNGSYRQLLTELCDIQLAVPRTRRFAPIGVVRAYARRPEQVDRMPVGLNPPATAALSADYLSVHAVNALPKRSASS
jgi:hypothetical protein